MNERLLLGAYQPMPNAHLRSKSRLAHGVYGMSSESWQRKGNLRVLRDMMLIHFPGLYLHEMRSAYIKAGHGLICVSGFTFPKFLDFLL